MTQIIIKYTKALFIVGLLSINTFSTLSVARASETKEVDVSGTSLLYLAGMKNEIDTFNDLLEKGFSPHTLDYRGLPIVYTFMLEKKYDFVKALGKYGANMKYIGPSGYTLLDNAYRSNDEEMISYLRAQSAFTNVYKKKHPYLQRLKRTILKKSKGC